MRIFKFGVGASLALPPTAGGMVSAPPHYQPNKIQLILAHLLHRLLALSKITD